MNERLAQPTMITAIALAAYGGLVALALLVASWWGMSPWGGIEWSMSALETNLLAAGKGALATIPLLLALVILDRWTPWLLLPLKQSVEREVVPLLQYSTTGEFLLISIAAGLGEELFFRGLVQAGIAMELESLDTPYAVAIAVAAASIIFGVCHWINRDYAIAATLIGVYLGLLFIYTGNLLAPITTHALYDFVAMWYLVVWKGNQRKWPGSSG